MEIITEQSTSLSLYDIPSDSVCVMKLYYTEYLGDDQYSMEVHSSFQENTDAYLFMHNYWRETFSPVGRVFYDDNPISYREIQRFENTEEEHLNFHLVVRPNKMTGGHFAAEFQVIAPEVIEEIPEEGFSTESVLILTFGMILTILLFTTTLVCLCKLRQMKKIATAANQDQYVRAPEEGVGQVVNQPSPSINTSDCSPLIQNSSGNSEQKYPTVME